MENLVRLSGIYFDEDKRLIESGIEEKKVFILMNLQEKLNKYIDYMFREVKVKNSDLCRLKICRQILFPENSVSVITREDKKTVGSMLRILSILHSTYDAVIIIENNDRALLAEIMQQFVYIEYNVSRLVIKLRNEVKEEKNSNIKIAVAASKKTGKSVLANCMLGMELAPTSLELATPNTCVYRKSRDEKFRVIVGSQSNEFADKDSIRKYIRNKFKEAQNDASSRFAIEDMVIEYPSNGNRFERYSIYDTPGPDAAGTDHYKSTERAISDCDVAIFAMDFSKYLTTSEEQFLQLVKDVFESKGKFHTLIFCLNKIDMIFQDKEAKSRIKVIEFIRNRLKEINPKYGDCIIFGTAALDYFHILELEEKAKKYEVPQRVRAMDLIQDMDDDFYDEVEDTIGEDEILNVLAGLEREAKFLHRQLGYPKVSLEMIRKFSGIPKLLDYVEAVVKRSFF